MSAYRKRWIEILKEQQIEGWHIDEHGQAIVIKVPEENSDTAEKLMLDTVNRLTSTIDVPAEWLKFIFYNGKIRFQYILNQELKDQR